MLRFDVPPVPANVIRLEAFLVFCMAAASLALGAPWLLIITAVQGFVKGFIGHTRCPSHRLLKWLLQRRSWQGKSENAGAKMFAAKVLWLASTVAVGLYVLGSPMWQVPCAALMIFAFAEAVFAFCAGCWVYGAWYRKFPPQ